LLRGWGIGDEIALGIDNAAAEAILPPVDPGEHEGGRQELERAAEGKALVTAPADASVAVEDFDTKPAAVPTLERLKPLQHRKLCIIGSGSQAEQGRCGNERARQHGSA